MIKPVKKTRLYEDIIQQLMQEIETGRLVAGDRLPTERELAQQMKVSRTSIREALRAMELIGLVESRVGEGTYIKSLSLDKAFMNLARQIPKDDKFLLDMYDVRVLLETSSVRKAAEKRTEEHLEELRVSIKMLKKDMSKSKIRAATADTLFHKTIAQAAGNTALITVLSLCFLLINSFYVASDAYATRLDIIYEHEALYRAIEKRDGKAAEKFMRTHIQNAHAKVKLILANNAKK